MTCWVNKLKWCLTAAPWFSSILPVTYVHPVRFASSMQIRSCSVVLDSISVPSDVPSDAEWAEPRELKAENCVVVVHALNLVLQIRLQSYLSYKLLFTD